MAEKTKVTTDISIPVLKFLSFDTTDRFQALKRPLPIDNYEFQFNFETNIREEKSLLQIILTVDAFEKQNEGVRLLLAKMKLELIFHLTNFEGVIKKNPENKTLTVATNFLVMAAGIAVGTARGMFAIKVQDTIISNAIIPILNPRIFVQQKE